MEIRITSNNEHFLSVLNKNPNTDQGLYCTSLKDGVLLGNAVDANTYEIVFADIKHSYSPDQSNQIDFKSLCHPAIICDIIKLYFKHLLVDKEKLKQTTIPWLNSNYAEVDNKQCEIVLKGVFCSGTLLNKTQGFLFPKYFSEVEVIAEYNELLDIKITTNSISSGINLAALIGFFLWVSMVDDKVYIDEDFVLKYQQVLDNVESTPYFIYYLLVKRCSFKMKDTVSFLTSLSKQLKDNLDLDTILTPNSTQQDREKFVAGSIDYTKDILDYGCGELRHLNPIARNLSTRYIGYDLEDYSNILAKRQRKWPEANISFTTDRNEINLDKPTTLILCEVVEHLANDSLEEVIQWVLSQPNIEQIIITSPNIEFNKHYGLVDTLRHQDHVKEYTEEEFYNLASRFTTFTPTFHLIGDIVNKEACTFGCVLVRK